MTNKIEFATRMICTFSGKLEHIRSTLKTSSQWFTGLICIPSECCKNRRSVFQCRSHLFVLIFHYLSSRTHIFRKYAPLTAAQCCHMKHGTSHSILLLLLFFWNVSIQCFPLSINIYEIYIVRCVLKFFLLLLYVTCMLFTIHIAVECHCRIKISIRYNAFSLSVERLLPLAYITVCIDDSIIPRNVLHSFLYFFRRYSSGHMREVAICTS